METLKNMLTHTGTSIQGSVNMNDSSHNTGLAYLDLAGYLSRNLTEDLSFC